jgi:MYXO-CTERM domain-containing protein
LATPQWGDNAYCDDGIAEDPEDDGNEQKRLWDDKNGNESIDAGELDDRANLISAVKETVLATCTGDTKNNHDLGMTVIIDHKCNPPQDECGVDDDGEYSLYAHLSAIHKDIWDKVRADGSVHVNAGDPIGVAGGSSGVSFDKFTRHLHFEIKKTATLSSSVDGLYWGYTPDLPNGYGYIDPKEKLFPPEAPLTKAVVVKVVGDEPGSEVANRGARIQSLPGKIYDTFGWTGKNQRFFSDQQATFPSVPGQIWYRIHLPSRLRNYKKSSEPVTGWIASKTTGGAILVEEDVAPATIIEVDNDGNGAEVSYLRLNPDNECSDPLSPDTCVSVWDNIRQSPTIPPRYRHVRVWNGTRFIQSDTRQVGGVTWHQVYLPKLYFKDPQTDCNIPLPDDQCIGGIDRAWITDDAIRIVDNPSLQDLMPPEIVSVDLSPTSINVRSDSAIVTLTANIVDDLSGFDYGAFSIYSPSKAQHKTVYLSGGSSSDDVYEGVITFPRFSEAGEWTLDAAILYDKTTNRRDYSAADFLDLGETTVEVISDEDTTSPVITSIVITPESIDASNGDASINLTVSITDDLAGFDYAKFYFFSPSNSQRRILIVSNLDTGDMFDGIYKEVVTFPRYSEAGDWRIRYAYLWDKAGSRWYVSEQDLINLSSSVDFDIGFTMTAEPHDIQVAELLEFDVAPNVINTILSPATATFSMRIVDDLSGFSDGWFKATSPSAGQNHGMFFGSNHRVSGKETDGWYDYAKEFPRYSEFGEWHISQLYLYDRTSNLVSYAGQEIDDWGLNTTFYIEGVIASGSYSIGAGGGTIETPDGVVTVLFPVNALSQDTNISITSIGRFDPVVISTGDNPLLGNTIVEYDFGPDGLEFSVPVTVTMTVDVTDLDQDQRDSLNVYLYTDTDVDGTPDTFLPIPAGQVLSTTLTENQDGTVVMTFGIQLNHFSTYAVILPIEAPDTIAPDVQITVPLQGATIKDTATFAAEVVDESGIDSVVFTIREADQGEGTIIGYEDVSAVQQAGTNIWELEFDSTQVLDGNYMLRVKAIDQYGNESTDSSVLFSIQNTAVVQPPPPPPPPPPPTSSGGGGSVGFLGLAALLMLAHRRRRRLSEVLFT